MTRILFGASWGSLALSEGVFGPLKALRAPWADLDACWTHLWQSWNHIGLSWGRFESFVGRLEAVLEVFFCAVLIPRKPEHM